MFKTRWKKVFRDLLSNKMRMVLVVMAIAIGVWAFGSVFITQEILLQNMDKVYRASQPSTLSMNLVEFDQGLIRWLEIQPGVEKAQGKAKHQVKIVIDEETKKSIMLESVPDFI